MAVQVQNFTPEDVFDMAAMIYGEARGEDYQGKVAVGHVAQNRSNIAGITIGQAVYGKSQFSAFNPNDENRGKIEAAARSQNSAWQEAVKAATDVLSGRSKDPTKGATHYHTPQVSPKWGRTYEAQGKKTTTIGNHIFYRAVEPGTFRAAARKSNAIARPAETLKSIATIWSGMMATPARGAAGARGGFGALHEQQLNNLAAYKGGVLGPVARSSIEGRAGIPTPTSRGGIDAQVGVPAAAIAAANASRGLQGAGLLGVPAAAVAATGGLLGNMPEIAAAMPAPTSRSSIEGRPGIATPTSRSSVEGRGGIATPTFASRGASPAMGAPAPAVDMQNFNLRSYDDIAAPTFANRSGTPTPTFADRSGKGAPAGTQQSSFSSSATYGFPGAMEVGSSTNHTPVSGLNNAASAMAAAHAAATKGNQGVSMGLSTAPAATNVGGLLGAMGAAARSADPSDRVGNAFATTAPAAPTSLSAAMASRGNSGAMGLLGGASMAGAAGGLLGMGTSVAPVTAPHSMARGGQMASPRSMETQTALGWGLDGFPAQMTGRAQNPATPGLTHIAGTPAPWSTPATTAAPVAPAMTAYAPATAAPAAPAQQTIAGPVGQTRSQDTRSSSSVGSDPWGGLRGATVAPAEETSWAGRNAGLLGGAALGAIGGPAGLVAGGALGHMADRSGVFKDGGWADRNKGMLGGGLLGGAIGGPLGMVAGGLLGNVAFDRSGGFGGLLGDFHGLGGGGWADAASVAAAMNAAAQNNAGGGGAADPFGGSGGWFSGVSGIGGYGPSGNNNGPDNYGGSFTGGGRYT